ncbi:MULTISPECIES: HNH endonuclease [unclassified Flavobacterium]|uniref:HNH endonuclease n=1 Tax=unclassified Flavobacterium TaxID=196869 RepID=UPI0006ABB2C4|nr:MULTISPECIES: HNH endonuclease [unclassified Flavobacterium]KOP38487.1 hypothetical protein AKO67_09845 [Flavobacterium sp. VMW]OWU88846.1 hypothetical protein APR43_20645 [Flavobacterium sp. NLM]
MISLVNKNIDEAFKFHYIEVSKLFNDIITNGYINRGRPSVKKFLPKCFLRFLSNNFDTIISGEPELLINLHLEYERLGLVNEDKELVKDFMIKTGYDNFNNITFLEKMEIDTCVYCNKNYTLSISKMHARAQLDHWFPKDKFPILALSFYNLIPSCQSCNHLKGNCELIIKQIIEKNDATKAEILLWLENALLEMNHPYMKSENFQFTWFFDNSLNNSKTEFRVKDKKTRETLKFNRTKEIYNAHSNKELRDLLDLRSKYSKNYLDILLNKTFSHLSISEEEAYRMIFGIEIIEEDYHKRPFSKFKHDIIKELLK